VSERNLPDDPMPAEMPVLHKRAKLFLDMEHGGYQQEWVCVEYPQIHVGVFALTRKTKPAVSFTVDGVPGEFKTIREAYNALRDKTALKETQS
jgi:hypothetical protein